MKIKVTYLVWILFPAAVLAWAAVGLFAWIIATDEVDRALYVQVMQETESKEAIATRLHAIVQDTAEQRAQLDSILRMDVVSIVDMIEEVGKAAGVRITVSNAIPENVPPSQAAGGAGIIATGFVVEAQGRFSTLMRVVQLFETLPIPSTLGRLDMERTAKPGNLGTSDTWRMNAYIRVLTTADISS